MTKAVCGNCGIEYTFPEKVSDINCACGAKVFRPKGEEPVPPPKEEKEEKAPELPKEEEKDPIEKKSKKKRLLNKLRKKAVSQKPKKKSDEHVDSILEDLDKPPGEPNVLPPTPPEPPKEEKTLLQKLIAIPGIAEKAAKEICEEYKTVEEIKAAIDVKTFSVGGVGLFKKLLIKNRLK